MGGLTGYNQKKDPKPEKKEKFGSIEEAFAYAEYEEKNEKLIARLKKKKRKIKPTKSK